MYNGPVCGYAHKSCRLERGGSPAITDLAGFSASQKSVAWVLARASTPTIWLTGRESLAHAYSSSSRGALRSAMERQVARPRNTLRPWGLVLLRLVQTYIPSENVFGFARIRLNLFSKLVELHSKIFRFVSVVRARDDSKKTAVRHVKVIGARRLRERRGWSLCFVPHK